MKLYPIETGKFKLDGGAMFGVVPKILWQKVYPADENNLIKMSMRSLLVDNGKQRILIDTGMGDKQSEKFFSFLHLFGDETLEKSLAGFGYSPEDITDVVMTHLHFDHCGGGVKYDQNRTKLELSFKNAKYWVTKGQWDTALHPNKREGATYFKDNYIPLQENGRLNLIEEDTELYPGFKVRIFNGHTDGQIIPLINYDGKTIVFMADLLPFISHINLVWIMSYDIQPLITLEEKQKFLEEAVKENYILFFQHDFYNESCTVKLTPKGIKPDRIFPLSEMLKLG